nr:Uncharacterised protein [Klebsiella pneumoniae]
MLIWSCKGRAAAGALAVTLLPAFSCCRWR